MKNQKTKNCYPNYNKQGELVSYRFFFTGQDPMTGKQKQYTMTWKVPRGMNNREIELERRKAEIEFINESEKKSFGTFIKESNITFEEFANQWLNGILARNEESYCYYVRAKNTIKLLNEHFGRFQLRQINPNMVQRFYDFLGERTFTKEIVTVKKSIYELIEAQGLKKTQVAEACGLDKLTLRIASKVGNKIGKATATKIAKHFKVPITKYFDIERKEVKYSKDTNQGIRTLLVVILGEAKRQQIIEHNYASKDFTRPMIGTSKPKEIFDEEEAKEFVKAVLREPNLKKKTVLGLLIFLGLRKAEICGLSWSNINFDRKTLSVEKNTLYLQGFGIVTKGTKTETSKRTIYLPDQMLEILSTYKNWYDEQKENYGDLWENTDRLFLQDNGKPMCPSTVNNWLKNFNLEHGFKTIPPHALRHTCITMQIIAGVPLKTVSKRAGHANERITLDIYTHSLESQDERAAEMYNKYLLA